MLRRRSERGAAAVEFALVVPLLLLLMLGIVEFGRAFFIQSTLSGAAREGVRIMALSTNPASAQADAKAATIAAAPGLGLTSGQITVTPSPSCPTTGTAEIKATVTVTYQFAFMTDLVGGAPINLTGKGVMRCNG